MRWLEVFVFSMTRIALEKLSRHCWQLKVKRACTATTGSLLLVLKLSTVLLLLLLLLVKVNIFGPKNQSCQ